MCVLAGAGACSEAALENVAAELDPGSCEYRFASSAARTSHAGTSMLLYDCTSEACNGEERFAQNTSHAIQVEVEAGPESALGLHVDDPRVGEVLDVASSYDPCAQRMRIWATLEVKEPGAAKLVVSQSQTELDTLELVVSAPAAIALRATALSEFSFAEPRSMVTVAPGESVLVLPELRDATGALLVGLPKLTWHVDNPDVAQVRTAPDNEDESFARERAAASSVFVDAHEDGETRLRVRAQGGASGELPLRVESR